MSLCLCDRKCKLKRAKDSIWFSWCKLIRSENPDLILFLGYLETGWQQTGNSHMCLIQTIETLPGSFIWATNVHRVLNRTSVCGINLKVLLVSAMLILCKRKKNITDKYEAWEMKSLQIMMQVWAYYYFMILSNMWHDQGNK